MLINYFHVQIIFKISFSVVIIFRLLSILNLVYEVLILPATLDISKREDIIWKIVKEQA